MEATVLLIFATLLLIILISKFIKTTVRAPEFKDSSSSGPKSYPLVGSLFSMMANADRLTQYMSDRILASPTHTAIFPLSFGSCLIATANPSNVEHILKTRFYAYPKGSVFYSLLYDLLGDGIFNTDGETWKIQRKIASREFNNRSLHKLIDTTVKSEISDRLLPLLGSAAAEQKVLDFQDVLQRFGFDNICMIVFGSDPGCLDPSWPPSDFAVAFDDAVWLIGKRFVSIFPIIWQIKRFLRVGSEKQLHDALSIVNGYAEKLVHERKQQQRANSMVDNSDLLRRFISSSDDADEKFVKDMVIGFILAGRDTTSAALTWLFWLVCHHERVEDEILKELSAIESDELGLEEVKEMNYLHAAFCESMRLYPPLPSDSKEAAEDDILPDGTMVPKGV